MKLVSGILDDLSFEDLEREFSKKNTAIEKPTLNKEVGTSEKSILHVEKAVAESIGDSRALTSNGIRTGLEKNVPEGCGGLVDNGFELVDSDHNCFHFFNESIDIDVYYIPREKKLAFHPKYEKLFGSKGIYYVRFTNYYMKKFPSQPTGYLEPTYVGLGVAITVFNDVAQIMEKVLSCVDKSNIYNSSVTKETVSDLKKQINRKSFDLSAWTQNSDTNIVNDKDDKLFQKNIVQNNSELSNCLEQDCSGKSCIGKENDKNNRILNPISPEKMRERYKEWLKKEGFLEHVISKLDGILLMIDNGSVFSIVSYDVLLKKFEDYCKKNRTNTITKTAIKYYKRFFIESSQEEFMFMQEGVSKYEGLYESDGGDVETNTDASPENADHFVDERKIDSEGIRRGAVFVPDYLDWNSDIEGILQKLSHILSVILEGTDYYVRRNAKFGERDVDIFKKGEDRRIGQIWPKKYDQRIELTLPKELISTDVKELLPEPTSERKNDCYYPNTSYVVLVHVFLTIAGKRKL